jgi:NAD(P)-dependent dehydrogenase (short-subunit alcohol dehydrogenase family)
LKEVPGAEVVTFEADVKDSAKAEEAVKVAISRFGRLDIVIANAGTGSRVDKRGCIDNTLRSQSWMYELTIQLNSAGGQRCK